MTIYGILCKYTDFTNLADFLKVYEDYFTNLLDLKNSTPSHDTLSNVFASIDTKKFMDLFIEWIKEIVKNKGLHISIDGKAVKSASDKINGENTPYIVSGFLSDIGISIGQVKVDDKSNEITAIPELLDLIDIEGSTITIDAIGTQEEIANKIVEKNGHYVLKVKNNQKELNRDVKRQFSKFNNLYGNEEVKYKKTVEKDHGRGEIREYFLTYQTNEIMSNEKWKTVKALAYVKVQTMIDVNVNIKMSFFD